MSAEETIDSVTTHENSVSDASYKEDEEDEEEEDDIVDEALHGSDRSDAEDFQENKRIPAATLRPSPPSVSPSPSTKKKPKTLTSAQLEEEQLLKEQDAGLDAEADDIMGADAPRLFLGEDSDSKKVSVEWKPIPRPCIPAYFQLELADYQALGLEQLEKAPNQAGILAADMGLGKTAQALGYICNRISRYEKEFKTKVGCQHLIVVPKSIVPQWEREFAKFVSPHSGIKILNMADCITVEAIHEVMSGQANIVLTSPYRTLESLKTFCFDADIKVWSHADMHYKSTEQLTSVFKACSDWNKSATNWRKENFAMHFSVDGMNCELTDKRKASSGAAAAWTFFPKWSTLVVDEAHAWRNCSNLGWRSLFGIRAESRVLLTATPLHNSLDDIYSYLRLIRVPSLVNTETWFAKGYGSMRDKDAYLDRMCKGHLIWIRKGDIPNLNIVPKLNFHVVAPFSNKVEEKYYAAWSSMAGKFANEVGTANKGSSKKLAHVKVRTAVLRCRQVCGAAFVLNDLNRCDGFAEKDYPGLNDKNGWAGLYSSKINAVVEIVKDHVKSGEKFTVVTYFKSMIDMIVERMAKEGIKAISYTGDMTTVQRDAAIESFKRDPSVSALVCSLSISVGLSLGWANRAIMVDPWWNPQVSLQAENRVHRYDSKKEVRIDCIVMSGTIEEAISKIAQARLDLANQFHSVANLRELLRLKRFNGASSAASARKHGTSLQSSSMPRYEALIKHAEVLWHKRSEKRVCEECMYEAGLKSLRQESAQTADPKGDGRPLEEIAYLRVRNHHSLEEPTPGTKRRPIPLEEDKEPTSKKPLLRPEAPIPATLAPVPKALPTIRDLAKNPLPVAPLPAPTKLPAAAAAVEPAKRKETPSPEGDAASKKPKQQIQEPPVSGVVALTEDTVGNLLQVLFANVKVVLRVWPNTCKSDALKAMAARVALDQSGANYQISYALAGFDNLRRETTLYGGMTKAQRDVVDIAKPVFDATVISSMEESARTRADAELKAKQKMYTARICRLAGYSEGIPELVRLKRCFFENLLSNAVRNSRNLEHYLYDALDPILPLLVVAEIEMGAAYATGMPRFKSTLATLKTRRCEKALQFYENIQTITSSAFVRDGTHPHCTIQELGSTVHTGLMPLLVARVFLDLLGGDRNFRTHINEHSITVTTPEGFLIVQESTVSGSFFTVSLYDEGEPKRLFLTDLVFNGSGFNEQKIKSSLAGSACERALAKILESCLTEYPRYVLCPTWAHPAVETALSKHFPEKVYECVTFSKRISTISKDELPDNLKTILWPWWSEFVLVP